MKKDVQLQKNRQVLKNPFGALLNDANNTLTRYLEALRAAEAVVPKDAAAERRSFSKAS